MKHVTQLLAIALLVSSVWAGLTACQNGQAQKAKESPSGGGAPKLPVDVVVVKASTYRQDETLVGTLVPNRRVDIASEVARKVIAVTFRDGSTVAKGQMLYQLDDADLQARLRKVGSELSLAILNEQRLAALLKTQAVRQQEYDQVQTALQILQADEEILHVELAKTQIRAPFAGLTGTTQVQVGSFITPGQVLTRLHDLSHVKIRFAVPETHFNMADEGRTVLFTTRPGETPRRAVIRTTEPDIDVQSRTLTVEAVAQNADRKWRAGMSVQIAFPTRHADTKGIQVPTEALIPASEGYSVFVVKDGKATSRMVRVENRSETDALVSGGLQTGDTLIISNLLKATDGTAVQIVSSNVVATKSLSQPNSKEK